MKILFLSDCNGHERENPKALLMEVYGEVTKEMLKNNEQGNRFSGGDPLETLDAINVEYDYTEKGDYKWKKKSDYTDNDYDLKYMLFSGNY